jgi:altronate hydrolase
MTAPKLLRLHPLDPVAVALADIGDGEVVGEAGLRARGDITRGHKLALEDIAAGAPVRKLGVAIGAASRDIQAGEWVHTHNLAFRPASGERRFRIAPQAGMEPASSARFDGYLRGDGRVGTRNYLVVMATVNCSATVARAIAERFTREIAGQDIPGFDGVVAIAHEHGCSVRADGPGMASLRRTLGGYANHANVAGTLVVGLGCEDNQVEAFLAASGLAPSPRLRALVIQQEGGTASTVAAGVEALRAMLPLAAGEQRRSAPAAHLTVGLQCGGSDGFSALTANPALGRAVDRLVEAGGTAILSETPELYGAESLLLDRVASAELAEKLISKLQWWEAESRRDGGSLDNNPSAGNHAGGITTIVEKSLGSVAKAGSTPLMGVYDYAEAIGRRGLVFMDSPGYDPVSATGQVAAGANLICFTTGRGSCFGCKPAPSVKLATNSAMFARMAGDMDLNCGEIADGTASLDEMGERIFELILATASGRPTASETLGYGTEEFIPWTPGLTY